MKYKLGEICKIVSGTTPKTSIAEYWDGDIKWLTPAEIKDDSYTIYDTVRKITLLGKEKSGLNLFPKGTVILSSRAPIGKVAIAGCDMCFNQGFKNLICSETVYNKYLYWFLKNKKDYLNSLGRGATFKELSKQIVSEIIINLPSYNEQEKIVDKLERLQKIVATRKHQLLQLDKLTKSLFVEMFINENYTKKKLGECAIINPKKSSDKRLHDELEVSFIPMMAVGENGQINVSKIKKFADVKNGFSYFSEGDVLFAKITPSMENGKGAIASNLCNGIGFVSTEFHVIRPIENITTSEWIYVLTTLQKFRLSAEANMTGSAGQKRVPASFLQDYSFYLPPIELQKQFSRVFKHLDKHKSVVQKSLDETQLLFDSLMQKYFG